MTKTKTQPKTKIKVNFIEENKTTSQVFKAFESEFHLVGFVEFELKGRKVGAALLNKGKSDYKLVFGFKTVGIHPTLRTDQLMPTKLALESGLKEIPQKERITFHLKSFAEDSDRFTELTSLMNKAPLIQLKLLLAGEKKRGQELKKIGLRQPKSLYIFTTYTVDSVAEETGDSKSLIDELVIWLSNQTDNFWAGLQGKKGEGAEFNKKKRHKFFLTAFNEGYLRWEQLLDIKMGLTIEPLSSSEYWDYIWHQFNNQKTPSVPQIIKITKEDIEEEININKHPISKLIEGEKGLPNCPDGHPSYIKMRRGGNESYIGVAVLTSKPVGFDGVANQLRFLWDILCKPQVKDIEIITQFSAANPTVVKSNMERVTKQNNLAVSMAADHQNIDVGANLNTRKSVQTQEKIYEGAIPLNVAVTMLVHRPSLPQLNDAMSTLSDCFQLPAKLIREVDYAWKIWLQTFSICWENILSSPFNRRSLLLTDESLGFTPITMTKPGSKTGFELIADEGGAPVKIDFIKSHRNIAVFGTTRSGKSVIVSGMLTQALAANIPVVALDYPKPDGTSTFTDYTKFLGQAYFDILKESNNLFEIPDLRGVELEEQQERFQDYRAFLESALVTMVLPESEGKVVLEQTVRSLVGKALTEFFENDSIVDRYNKALEGGFGSPAWKETPTLTDYIKFCENVDLEALGGGGTLQEAQAQILLQLKYWQGSRVGKAIGNPSSFPTDVSLLVFALRNLSNQSEAAILALSAYSAALRRALSSPASIFFVDESPILFKFKEIATLIARLCANGAKAGIRVFLSGQDPNTIVESHVGSQIMQNMNTRLIGRIQVQAIESFTRLLYYERNIIAKNASESFFPKRSELYSNWLLDIDGTYTYCRYYPGALQIAAVANNPDEQEARDRVLSRYPPEKKLEALVDFANQYTAAIKNGVSLENVG